jgi:hypothetical protein
MATKKFYSGFFTSTPDYPPSTVLFFKDVGYGSSFPSAILFSFLQPTLHSSTSSAQVQFTPILRGYITTDYQETEILRGQIASPVLFNRDLTQLEEESNWKITYNAGSGIFTIDKV